MQTEERTLVWALIVRAGLGFVFPPLIMLGLHTLAPRGDQRRLGFTEYHAANCRDGWHCPGRGAARTLALCASPYGRRASRRTTVAVEQVQGMLAWMLQGGGDVGELLHTKVQAVLSRYLDQESLVVAFQDCFIVFARRLCRRRPGQHVHPGWR